MHTPNYTPHREYRLVGEHAVVVITGKCLFPSYITKPSANH